MKKSKFIPKVVFLVSLLTLEVIGTVNGQNDNASLSRIILQADSLFWKAYNECATDKFEQFFTEKVEFYHDKGGITNGLAALATSMKNNLCSNPNFKLRREAVAGSMNVYPLASEGNIYGAILTGDHVFYVLEPNKPDRLDGKAKFTHLWLKESDHWKMSRILSFDHGPAQPVNKL